MLNSNGGCKEEKRESLKVNKTDRSIVKKGEPVMCYLKDGPERGFVRKELFCAERY